MLSPALAPGARGTPSLGVSDRDRPEGFLVSALDRTPGVKLVRPLLIW
jgi:hypothetical protein